MKRSIIILCVSVTLGLFVESRSDELRVDNQWTAIVYDELVKEYATCSALYVVVLEVVTRTPENSDYLERLENAGEDSIEFAVQLASHNRNEEEAKSFVLELVKKFMEDLNESLRLDSAIWAEIVGMHDERCVWIIENPVQTAAEQTRRTIEILRNEGHEVVVPATNAD